MDLDCTKKPYFRIRALYNGLKLILSVTLDLFF